MNSKDIKYIQFEGKDIKKIDLSNSGGKSYRTNINGLDELLNDGIVLPTKLEKGNNNDSANGVVILVKGKPGTGKTTLAMQMATGLTNSIIRKNSEKKEDKSTQNKNYNNPEKSISLVNSKYYSIEQGKNELEDKLLDIEISRILHDIKSGILDETKTQEALSKLDLFFDFDSDESKIKPITPNEDPRYWNLSHIKQLKYSCVDNQLVYFPKIKFPLSKNLKMEEVTIPNTETKKYFPKTEKENNPESSQKQEGKEKINTKDYFEERLKIFPEELKKNESFLQKLKIQSYFEIELKSILANIEEEKKQKRFLEKIKKLSFNELEICLKQNENQPSSINELESIINNEEQEGFDKLKGFPNWFKKNNWSHLKLVNSFLQLKIESYDKNLFEKILSDLELIETLKIKIPVSIDEHNQLIENNLQFDKNTNISDSNTKDKTVNNTLKKLFTEKLYTNEIFLKNVKYQFYYELDLDDIIRNVEELESKIKHEEHEKNHEEINKLKCILLYVHNHSNELEKIEKVTWSREKDLDKHKEKEAKGKNNNDDRQQEIENLIFNVIKKLGVKEIIKNISLKAPKNINDKIKIINNHLENRYHYNEVEIDKLDQLNSKEEFLTEEYYNKQIQIISHFIKGFNKNIHRIIKKILDENKISSDQVKSIIALDKEKIYTISEIINKEIENSYSSKGLTNIEKVFNLEIKTDEANNTSNEKVFSKSPGQKILDFINDISASEKTKENNASEKFPCIVLDGLNILSEQEKKMINLHHVFKVLRDNAYFSVIVFDGIDSEDKTQDFLSDMIIELRGEEKNFHYYMNDLRIPKSRYQSIADGWHQYKIKDFGLLAFKSLDYHSHKEDYLNSRLMQSFVNPQLDKKNNGDDKSKYFNIERILYEPTPGSFTVVLGPRATFKTKLSLGFLYGKTEKAKDSDGDSLLISLVDNLGVLENSCSCQFENIDHTSQDSKCIKCHSQLYIFHIRPGIITSEEFFHYLERRITEHETHTQRKITRLAFWDLTQIDYRFPMFLDNPMFLSSLVEFGKDRNIAMCIMGAGNSKLTPSASAIADNVVFCWRDSVSKDMAQEKGEKVLKIDSFAKDFLKSNQNNDNDKLCDEFLAIYVDRCAGLLGGEGRELTYLPIITEGNKQSIILNCPNPEENKKVEVSRYTIVNNKISLLIENKKIELAEEEKRTESIEKEITINNKIVVDNIAITIKDNKFEQQENTNLEIEDHVIKVPLAHLDEKKIEVAIVERRQSDKEIVNKKHISKFDLSSSNIIKVEDIDLFRDTKEMTQKIAALQGIGKIN